MIPPIKKSIVVPLDTRSAFDLFTDGINRWWPTDSHSVSARRGESPANVKIEPKVGGHVIETLSDGSQARWATVQAYDPGTRLVLSWYVGQDEDEATHVTVLFRQTDTGTKVDLIHQGFEALDDQGETMSQTYLSGWDHVLGCFAAFCVPVHA